MGEDVVQPLAEEVVLASQSQRSHAVLDEIVVNLVPAIDGVIIRYYLSLTHALGMNEEIGILNIL